MNQFESEFERFHSEIIRFYSQIKLLVLLLRKIEENSHAMKRLSNLFHVIINGSLIYGILLDVNRLLLDKSKNSKTFIDFVKSAKDHSGLFSEELLSKRLKRQSTNIRNDINWSPPTKSDFDSLLKRLGKMQEKFKHYKDFRDKYLAHFSSDYAKGAYNAETRINPEELDSLAEDMWSIYIKVRCWYRGSVHLPLRIESKLQKELDFLIRKVT